MLYGNKFRWFFNMIISFSFPITLPIVSFVMRNIHKWVKVQPQRIEIWTRRLIITTTFDINKGNKIAKKEKWQNMNWILYFMYTNTCDLCSFWCFVLFWISFSFTHALRLPPFLRLIQVTSLLFLFLIATNERSIILTLMSMSFSMFSSSSSPLCARRRKVASECESICRIKPCGVPRW